MQNLAPIALFVYNRPQHTERTITYLRENHLAKQSQLFIFSDGAKGNSDLENVQAVRDYLKTVDGFASVQIIEQQQNKGLANSIIDGVSFLCKTQGRVIVFEDDLISSPYCLQYFNDALNHFANEEKVMHIGAYMYPLNHSQLPETFFYRAATSWGWATWQRAWQHFNPNINQLMAQFNAERRHAFSIEGKMNFWKQMLDFKKGKNNSWAIRWYASIFLKGGLTLNPAQSLINNIGHDGSGIHSGINDIYNVVINPKAVKNFPSVLVENEQAYQAIKSFLATRKGNIWTRIRRYIHQKTQIS